MQAEVKELLLKECIDFHGHLCLGQALGLRIALAGMEWLGLEVSGQRRDHRNLITIVENDRCISDAISVVTGTRMGRRTLKLRDYGKMAATFGLLDEETKSIRRAVRVSVSDELDRRTAEFAAKTGLDPEADQTKIRAVLELPTGDFLDLNPVTVRLTQYELPGRPLRMVRCDSCGERVMDAKDLTKDGKVLCRSCAGGAYYEPDDEGVSC